MPQRLKVVANRTFGDHQITIFSGFATKFDTYPFTVRVDGPTSTVRISGRSEAEARASANKVWASLKSGETDLVTIAKKAVKS